MSWRLTDGTSLLRPLETLVQLSNKISGGRITETYCRRSTRTLLGVSFERYLQRRWDIQKGVVATSLQRLIAGLDVGNSNIKMTIRSQRLSMAHQILSKMCLRIGMLDVFLLT